MKTALTIAGSDSGGGAGIQADLKSFMAHKVHGMSAVTAITAQNTVGVQGVWPLPLEAVRAQIRSVFSDLPVDAIKTGMLATAELVLLTASELRAAPTTPLVVDPVMVATSGDRLLEADAVDAYKTMLFPMATIITPNIHEAGDLLGSSIRDTSDARDAARALGAFGAGAVLVKGGDLDDAESATDLLWDGNDIFELTLPKLQTTSTHGTGCTLAASIAAGLAQGKPLYDAVVDAKAYLHGALNAAFPLGKGHGPTNHHWRIP